MDPKKKLSLLLLKSALREVQQEIFHHAAVFCGSVESWRKELPGSTHGAVYDVVPLDSLRDRFIRNGMKYQRKYVVFPIILGLLCTFATNPIRLVVSIFIATLARVVEKAGELLVPWSIKTYVRPIFCLLLAISLVKWLPFALITSSSIGGSLLIAHAALRSPHQEAFGAKKDDQVSEDGSLNIATEDVEVQSHASGHESDSDQL
jgi:hypothetical protein